MCHLIQTFKAPTNMLEVKAVILGTAVTLCQFLHVYQHDETLAAIQTHCCGSLGFFDVAEPSAEQ